MKKIIFGTICFICILCNVYAFKSTFTIDVDKIDISSKADELNKELDKSYSIDTEGFSNKIVSNPNIEELTRKLIDLSLSDKDIETKKKEFADYLFIDSTNGVNSLTSSLFIETYLESLGKYKISYEYIKVIRLVEFEYGILSFAYLPGVNVDGIAKDLVLTFWFKENESNYQVHYAWFSIDTDLENYFNNLGNSEYQGNVIGGTYKNISLTGEKSEVTQEQLQNIYDNNVESSFQITGMSIGGNNMYGSAFSLRSGVVVTTWSLFIKFLSESEYIYVNDNKGNTYSVEGIIAADTKYDVVVLKLDQEVGKNVILGDANNLSLDDKLFVINSKANNGFSINYGSFIKYENGKLNNIFALNSADVGSALYNINGEVVGFNTADVLNSDLSYANSTDYLKDLQKVLSNTEFNNIKIKDIDLFKETYYQPLEEESKYTNVEDKVLDKFMKIGNLKENIALPLIKSSYKNKVLSLRYKNNASESLSTMYLVSSYIQQLEKDGYKNIYNKDDKKIYKNDDYQIIIKENMSYLIIVIMEV